MNRSWMKGFLRTKGATTEQDAVRAGRRLVGLRVAAGMAPRDLADLAKVSVRLVWLAEMGRLDADDERHETLLAAVRAAEAKQPAPVGSGDDDG